MGQTMSPTPQKAKPVLGFGFPQAIKEVTVGKKIHKLEWEDKEYYGIVKDGTLQLHKPDGKFYQWIINDGDLAGEDWTTL
jgi:hypothetical protein